MTDQISAVRLRDQLVSRLRVDVLAGRWRHGEPIRQQELGAKYGVSRTPVREALIRLKQEGLLVESASGAVTVAGEPEESTREFLNPMRQAVELYALRRCFDSLDQDDFVHWESIVAAMEGACRRRDLAALAEHDIAFHCHLVEKCGQPTVLAIWSLIVGGIRAHFRTAYESFPDINDVYREHVEILERFRAGDKSAAIKFYATRIGQNPLPSMPPASTADGDVAASDVGEILSRYLR